MFKLTQEPIEIDFSTLETKPFSGILWKTVYTLSSAIDLLWLAQARGERMGISYQDGHFNLYNPSNMVYTLFLGEVEVVRRYSNSRYNQMKLDDTVYSTIADYMKAYEAPDDYLSRARMTRFLHMFDEVEITPTLTSKQIFNPNKVEGFKPWTNHFKKPSVVMYYKGIPPLFGMKQIREVFPKISNRDLKRLYSINGIPLPYELRRSRS